MRCGKGMTICSLLLLSVWMLMIPGCGAGASNVPSGNGVGLTTGPVSGEVLPADADGEAVLTPADATTGGGDTAAGATEIPSGAGTPGAAGTGTAAGAAGITEISSGDMPSDAPNGNETGGAGGVSPERMADNWIEKHGLDVSASELDLSGIDLRSVDMDTVLNRFPDLERVTMIDCGLSNRGYALLQDRHPEIKIVWEIVLSHWMVRTDAVAFGTFKTTADTFFMDNEEAHYLKYCTDLVALDLGHNYVSDLSFLEYMPELKILILVDNVRLVEGDRLRHLTDLSELRYVPKLRYLEFFANNVSDFSFLQYLPELEDLNISYNSVYSIEYLTSLPNLKRLWMEHTNIPYEGYARLRQIYPYAQIVYEGEGSIDQGWRSGARYSAMRRMLRENVIDEIYQ